MGKYFRKSYRAKRFRRRKIFKRRGFNMRAAMSRRHPKPEIKWRQVGFNNLVAANTLFNSSLYPLSWSNDDSQGGFIGRRIKSRWISLNINVGTGSNQGTTVSDFSMVRISILGFRANGAAVASHIAAVGDTGVWDYNIVTTYYDKFHRFNNSDANPGGIQSTTIKKYIKFPRNIQLTPSNEDLSILDDKDKVVLLVNNTSANSPGVLVYGYSKLSYTDN